MMTSITSFLFLLIGCSIAGFNITEAYNWMNDPFNPTTPDTLRWNGKLTCEHITSMMDFINNHSEVGHLMLVHNEFGETEAQLIADRIKHSHITTLELSNNKIGAKGVKALAGVLNQTRIEALYLIANDMGDEGAEAIGEVLRHTSIIRLLIRDQNITDVGAEALAKGLIGAPVNFLGLEKNKIGDDGAKAIAESLPETDIATLELDENQIGSYGAKCISSKLRYTAVENLSLKSNKIGDDGIAHFASHLPETQVMYLGIDDNLLNPTAKEAIKTAYESNNMRIIALKTDWYSFVAVENGTQQFDLKKAYGHKSQYIEFANTVKKKKKIYAQILSNRLDWGSRLWLAERKIQLRDFLEDIDARLAKCFRKTLFVYQGLESFVMFKNRTLEFDVGNAYKNKSEYIEFAEIVGNNTRIYDKEFFSHSRLNLTEEQIEDFIGNVGTRLSECLRKVDLVYRAYKEFNESGSFNSIDKSRFDDFTEVISKEDRYIKYLMTIGNGTASKIRLYKFVVGVEERLTELKSNRSGGITKTNGNEGTRPFLVYVVSSFFVLFLFARISFV